MLSIDFEKAYRQAGSMMQCAGGIKQQSIILDDIITEIRQAWHGETAAAYVKKLEAFLEELKRNADQCRKSTAVFRAKINAVKEAEEIAASAFQD